MQSEIFVQWIQHFIKHTKPTKEHPVLLLLDGHATHVKNLAVIELARKNFITVLCFPPHTTHKLQPLDVSFMRPLSMYYSQEINIYLLNHPGRIVTLHEIGKIFGTAYNKAATVKNAVSGFNKTGIYPYIPEDFSDEDFIAADTTDIPVSTSTEIESSSNLTSSDTTDIPVSTLTDIESASHRNCGFIGFKGFFPFELNVIFIGISGDDDVLGLQLVSTNSLAASPMFINWICSAHINIF